ncbi:MAG: PQQ-binding-like beta-propeller repeat protein [Thaumarchaeota archaeon]|nr:PQQ-binding-like beta-propeller repeat protein [Nitrososphaerota archaeon]
MTRQIVLLSLIVATTLMMSMLAASSSLIAAPVSVAFGQAPSVQGANWEYVNYQQLGGSSNPQTQITKDNVQYLETKWILPYVRPPVPSKIGTGYGSGAAPLVVDGTVYVAMNDRRILAIDATTGKLLWNNTYGTSFDSAAHLAKYPFLSRVGAHVHAINYYSEKNWLITSSMGACETYAVDAKTGKTAWTLTTEQICGTTAEFGDAAKGIVGSLGNQGFLTGGGSHPPKFLGNIIFIPVPGGSGSGGRSHVTAFDMTDPQNPKRLYRTFTQPPAQGDPDWAIKQCTEANGNGWYFEYPRYLEGINHPARDREPTYLATKCTDVAADVVKNDGMDLVPGSPTFGKMHTATNHGSAVWGNYPLDPETGIVYLGWGDQGPYPNMTHKYGPGLHGSGFTAHDVKTGKLVWWFNAIPHDLWDYDCSWGGILSKTSAGQKIFIKGCKSGQVWGLDAATGKPIWVFDAPTIVRNTDINYGVDKNNNPKSPDACCRMTKEDMGKPWPNYPSKAQMFTICYTHCIESDIAADGKYVYVATHSEPRLLTVTNVRGFGNQGQAVRLYNVAEKSYGAVAGRYTDADIRGLTYTVIYAFDISTGKEAWRTRIDGFPYRGGLTVSGGIVFAYATDGNLKFLDAGTGKLLSERFFGIPVNVQPSLGATKDGKMRMFMHVGGGGGSTLGNGLPVDGTLVAFGLPDKIPEPQVVTKEVPKEVVKEVIKEVPKEVVKTVTVETISPISYAAIGISVVILVIAGVIFTRRRKT